MYIISIGNHAMAMGLIVQVMFGNLAKIGRAAASNIA
jgi:hypothetical protein